MVDAIIGHRMSYGFPWKLYSYEKVIKRKDLHPFRKENENQIFHGKSEYDNGMMQCQYTSQERTTNNVSFELCSVKMCQVWFFMIPYWHVMIVAIDIGYINGLQMRAVPVCRDN